MKDTMTFKKNMAVLKKYDRHLAQAVLSTQCGSDIELVKSKKGIPSLRVSNISLHSLYDPVKEAITWVEHHAKELGNAGEIHVLGFGLGYHLLELSKASDRSIIVYEPRLDIIKKAMECVDLTSLIYRVKIVTKNEVASVKDSFAILSYKPSVNLNMAYFENIQDKLRSLQSISRGLRIVVVGPIYGGSLQIAGYCSRALIKMGHTVEFIDNSRFSDDLFLARDISGDSEKYNKLSEILTTFISEIIMARCEEFRPDIVLSLAQSPLSPECLKRLQQKKTRSAYWFVEDFRLMDYWKKIAPHYDFFFTIQREPFFAELEKEGIRNYSYLPMAASPEIHRPLELAESERQSYGSDLSFVGAGYYNRRHFLKGLLDFDFRIWGSDWDMNSALAPCIQRSGQRMETDEIVKIFNATKININLHSSTYHRGIHPFGDFVNPRTFEIASCGGFQLADRRSEMDDLFEEGEEIILYDDLNDLRNKAAYYLARSGERERITRNARKRILQDHTYEQRMKEMLKIVAERTLEPTLWSNEGENVQSLLDEAEDDAELSKYLSRFSERKRVSLSGIVENITTGEGDLNRMETLFLMMNEFVR